MMRLIYLCALSMLALALWLASRAVEAPGEVMRDLSPCLPWQGACGHRWQA